MLHNQGPDYHVDAVSGRQRFPPAQVRVGDLLDFLLPPDGNKSAPEKCVVPVKNVPVIPGYNITAQIGRGGIGAVYKAVDACTLDTVAIKIILPELISNENAVRSFQRTIGVMTLMDHPNIVKILAHGKSSGNFYAVLEYMDGGSLADWVAQNGAPLPLETAAPVMVRVLDGLTYIHGQGHVHRGLKPRNILVSRSNPGTVRLAEFGQTKAFERAGCDEAPEQAPRSPGAALFGARERATRQKHRHPGADLFEIAAVFNWALTGDFIRPSLAVFPERFNALPKAVRTVLARALAESEARPPVARYPSAKAFRDALAEAFISSRIGY